ncbi:pentatricopeptide repeat-containing protein At3g12770-like [Magnolia sinica]|uniref:pentatricopeptide repeat-containing protein At3g12770-like n=1 Tax=Magnolia sinica TaxID=86752 RepID=UPI0026597468|nr:pentatricopeptide repeat-containing protein At3g12770-like [Magnolia sinica]
MSPLLSLFRRLEKPPFPPFLHNYHSRPFNHLLNSCSSLPDLKKIHAQILINGLSQDLLLSTKLIAIARSSSPTMDYARLLFDKTPQPDVFAWNTLIRGYADLGPCEQALILYKRMHFAGLSPDYFTFPSVVRSCAVLSALREGQEVHCNVIKNGFDSDVFVQSSLVSMYAQNGETSNSESVFDHMVERNVVSWTAMIAGYVQNGFFKQALGVFRRMVIAGTQPNAVTLVSVLPACAGLEILNLGQLIHGYGVKLGIDSDTPLVNSLIALYGKCGNVESARSLFDRKAPKNLVSWNAMIAAYEQSGAAADAIKLFRRMQTERVKFDYITMVSVISACASLGALNTGRWAHELVKSSELETNISILNALLDMYAKCGSIESARDVFEKLPWRSVVSWSAMISAYAAHGHGEDALQLFSRMLEEGIKPNSLTFTSVLTACRHSGLVDEGMKHFNSMRRDHSIVPGVEQCACIVDLLGRAGRLTDAYKFVWSMPVEPDVGVWGALLSACKIHGNLELAELVAEHLFRLDPQTIAYYVLMSNIYAEAGRWDDVARLRKLMEERELKKIPGRSLVEINRRFHTFLSGLRLHPS